ncbi:hypothetical protein C8T65DRAFT_22885 [Cerioporus squamosus]|nr:hypothetical protein C8T65DRAFT_22885 [Cerioporus squamosus]
MPPPHFNTDAILQLKRSAQSLARKTAPYAVALPSIPRSHNSSPSTTTLVLCPPKPLTPRLASLGVDEATAARISSSMDAAASRLKELCEAELQRRLKTPSPYFDDARSFSRIPATLGAIYTRAVNAWTTYLVDDVAPRVLRLQEYIRSKAHTQTKRPFNTGAVPLLESFFEENAFPTRLEKHELAAKSDMGFRQIHVWFQNHRRRSRQEGRELKRRAASGPLPEELEQSIIDALLPSHLDEADSDETSDDDALVNSQTFRFNPPPHAFPSPWPPLCSYDPFPIAPGER